MFGAIKHLALKKKCIKYTLKALCKNFKGVQKNSLLFKKETHLFESMHLKNAFTPFLIDLLYLLNFFVWNIKPFSNYTFRNGNKIFPFPKNIVTKESYDRHFS